MSKQLGVLDKCVNDGAGTGCGWSVKFMEALCVSHTFVLVKLLWKAISAVTEMAQINQAICSPTEREKIAGK